MSLAHSILALPEPDLRIGWLRDRAARASVSDLAKDFDELAQGAYHGNPGAREALVTVALYLVQERKRPLLEMLRQEAERRALLALARLLRQGDAGHSTFVESEPRIPTYASGRELTVGERRSLTKRPTKTELDRLLLDPHPLVVRDLLESPRLTEAHVVRLLSRRPARLVAIEQVVFCSRWVTRRAVRRALVLNPGTPVGIAMPLVGISPRDDLEVVLATTTVRPVVRAAALELLQLLPPLEAPSYAPLQ